MDGEDQFCVNSPVCSFLGALLHQDSSGPSSLDAKAPGTPTSAHLVNSEFFFSAIPKKRDAGVLIVAFFFLYLSRTCQKANSTDLHWRHRMPE